MKQAAGFPNSAGTRMTVAALSRVQSSMSGLAATEQMRIRAVNTQHSLSSRLPCREASCRQFRRARLLSGPRARRQYRDLMRRGRHPRDRERRDWRALLNTDGTQHGNLCPGDGETELFESRQLRGLRMES